MSSNLYQRIVAIMADMGAVGKGGKTSYGEKYEYHRIDDIDDQLRHALVTHGVVATITDIDERTLDATQDQDKYGKPRTTWHAECHITIELVNADNPEERTAIKGWGQGLDYSDKATGKAISYACKAAYLSAFHLRGQPDNEADDIHRRRKEAAERLSKEDQTYVTDALGEIAKAQSVEDLTALGEIIKGKPANIQDALRQAYKARYQQIKEQESE